MGFVDCLPCHDDRRAFGIVGIMGFTDKHRKAVESCERMRRFGVMGNQPERNWTAHMVLTSGHAGLAKEFNELERELYRVLAHVDDPIIVRSYLHFMRQASDRWFALNAALMSEK